jgi:hypothetical protein
MRARLTHFPHPTSNFRKSAHVRSVLTIVSLLRGQVAETDP